MHFLTDFFRLRFYDRRRKGQCFRFLNQYRKLRVAERRSKRLCIPRFFNAWVKLMTSNDIIDFKCAVIHHQSKLLSKVMRGLSLSLKKIDYLKQKKRFFALFKVFKGWRQLHVMSIKENIIVYRRTFKTLALAFYALKSNSEDVIYSTLEGD